MSNIKTHLKMETQIKKTEVGASYWNGNGAYQKESNRLWKELVPNSGEAETINGELIRCIGRLTYDYFNNGNCNVVEITQHECESCGGSGYEDPLDEDYEQEDCWNCGGDIYLDGNAIITPYYESMMEFLFEFAQDRDLIEELEQFILRNRIDFGKSSHIYSRVQDSIIHQVLISDGNKPNPYYKSEDNV